MINQWLWYSQCFIRAGLTGVTIVTLSLGISPATTAQVTPDSTLPTIVTTPTPLNYTITGGTQVGGNLFHSFEQFSVQTGQTAYFDNAPRVQNIISRVTGSQASAIDGVIQANGTANLFLLNPNGIHFGANASLQLGGSFLASTAQTLVFADGSTFSTTDAPHSTPLLTVSVPIGPQLSTIPQGSTLSNQGNLTVPHQLTLAADRLNLAGQLQAGGDLLLQSANPVQGAAHYSAGGNFRIEQLDGSPGRLTSPDDPVIRASGDVTIGGYQGASLHILAGGSVTIPGGVQIVAPDPVNGLVETVTLADGSTVQINGRTQPTLDIRAGTTAVGTPGLTNTVPPSGLLIPPLPNPVNTPTSANITIGAIAVNTLGTQPGQVFLTNQYQPNPALAGGITVGTINTQGAVGGHVLLNSSGGITIPGPINTQGGAGGNVLLTAQGTIDTTAASLDTSAATKAGDVQLRAGGDLRVGNITAAGQASGAIALTSGTTLNLNNVQVASVTGNFPGGRVELTAPDIRLTNGARVVSLTQGSGEGGTIQVATQTLLIQDQARIVTNTISPVRGQGGDLILNATESIDLLSGGGLSAVVTQGTGDAGNLVIHTNRLTVRNTIAGGSTGISTATEPVTTGSAGDLMINAQVVELIGNQPGPADALINLETIQSVFSSPVGAGLVSVSQGRGNAGNIVIKTDRLVFRDEAAITTSAGPTSAGQGGNLTIQAHFIEGQGTAFLGTTSFGSSGNPQAGDLSIQTDLLTLLDGATIATGTLSGNGGAINLQATNLLLLRNGSLITTNAGQAGLGGDGGNINLTAGFVVAVPRENSDITANAFEGRGGNINISTNAIFGLQASRQLTPLSDITASSQLGVDGTIQINTLEVDPNRGIVQLPTNPADATRQVAQTCSTQARANSFIVTGRGGLPPSPSEALHLPPAWIDWREADVTASSSSQSSFPVSGNAVKNNAPASAIAPAATGWFFQPNGTVKLTGHSVLSPSLGETTPPCS